ncbi:MAG: class I SAM-dependent methyltransferase [Rhizomicrobium sp.]
MSVLDDPALEAFLDALHARSEGQTDAIEGYFRRRIADGTLSWDGFDGESNAFFADKMVALEKVKAEYCYLLCRALNARRVVECGTSFGVSTLYLAAALRDNAAASGAEDGSGAVVIATEYEPVKARAARRNFETAGLAAFVDLREGDLRETLRAIPGPVDFVLLDIWTEAVMPAMARIAPHLRPGSVVVADNTVSARRGYDAYFAFIADPANRLRSMTLPFEGGLEVTVRI